MTKQFAKKSIAVALTTAALAFVAATPVRAADQNDWFEQQRSLTDGGEVQFAAPRPRTAEGARSRVGEPAANPERRVHSIQQEWLLQELRRSDGPGE